MQGVCRGRCGRPHFIIQHQKPADVSLIGYSALRRPHRESTTHIVISRCFRTVCIGMCLHYSVIALLLFALPVNFTISVWPSLNTMYVTVITVCLSVCSSVTLVWHYTLRAKLTSNRLSLIQYAQIKLINRINRKQKQNDKHKNRTRKSGNCECIAIWGRPSQCQPFPL